MTVSDCCLIKSLPWSFKYTHILALEMASQGNQHCVNCIGTLSFAVAYTRKVMRDGYVYNLNREPRFF